MIHETAMSNQNHRWLESWSHAHLFNVSSSETVINTWCASCTRKIKWKLIWIWKKKTKHVNRHNNNWTKSLWKEKNENIGKFLKFSGYFHWCSLWSAIVFTIRNGAVPFNDSIFDETNNDLWWVYWIAKWVEFALLQITMKADHRRCGCEEISKHFSLNEQLVCEMKKNWYSMSDSLGKKAISADNQRLCSIASQTRKLTKQKLHFVLINTIR